MRAETKPRISAIQRGEGRLSGTEQRVAPTSHTSKQKTAVEDSISVVSIREKGGASPHGSASPPPSPSPPGSPTRSISLSHSSSLSSLHLPDLFPSPVETPPPLSPLPTHPSSPTPAPVSTPSLLELTTTPTDTTGSSSSSISITSSASPDSGTQDFSGESSQEPKPSRVKSVEETGTATDVEKFEPSIASKAEALEEHQSSGSLESFQTTIFNLFRRNKSQQELAGLQNKKLGLPNIGNTCFLNATLQCLYSVPSFCNDIMRQETLWSPTTKTPLKMQRYFGELHKARLGQPSYKNKRRLLGSVKRSLSIYNEEYNDYSQQDAHEFLTLILMKIKMEGETLQQTSLDYICPVQKFEFSVQCLRTCSRCGDKVYRDEEHNNLSLDLNPFLNKSLQNYFKPSELECTCWKCGCCQATVARTFLTLPRVLVLHMKRFHYDRGELRKLEDPVSIPPVLSLASLCGERENSLSTTSSGGSLTLPKADLVPSTASVTNDHQESSGDRESEQQGASVLDHSVKSTYRLSGTVCHLGESIDCGHYISDIIDPCTNEWLSISDKHVKKIGRANILKVREGSAYIIFYVLCDGDEMGDAPVEQDLGH